MRGLGKYEDLPRRIEVRQAQRPALAVGFELFLSRGFLDFYWFRGLPNFFWQYTINDLVWKHAIYHFFTLYCDRYLFETNHNKPVDINCNFDSRWWFKIRWKWEFI